VRLRRKPRRYTPPVPHPWVLGAQLAVAGWDAAHGSMWGPVLLSLALLFTVAPMVLDEHTVHDLAREVDDLVDAYDGDPIPRESRERLRPSVEMFRGHAPVCCQGAEAARLLNLADTIDPDRGPA
jgi:hypothetical protein